MTITRIFSAILYFIFLGVLGVVCFLRQIPGDFDRYIYDALVRSRNQTLEAVYPIVKHSNPRADASDVLDSPGHLGQLEPLYAIRPLYIQAISIVARTGVPIQKAISLISALSLVGIGVVLWGWTGAPLLAALVIASPAIVLLGRAGTPDAFSALFIMTSAWALTREKLVLGILLLLASVWVRTDNVLLVLFVLAWLVWNHRLSISHAGVLAGVAILSVLVINHFSGNYGWSILFRYSFIGGRSPAEVFPHVGLRQYLLTFAQGVEQIGGQQMTLWILIGLASWYWLPRTSQPRQLLIPVALAALARFILFPTPEDRYFAWAYLITAACFIEAIDASASRDQPAFAQERLASVNEKALCASKTGPQS